MSKKEMMIKVCGMRDAENIREVEALGIDLMGFIFWPKSSRYVSAPPAYLPTKCRRVGVFVDATTDDIHQHIDDYGLDIIQLHGHESPDFIRQLIQLHGHESPDFIRQLIDRAASRRPCRGGVGGGVTIIKAFSIATKEDLEQTKPYEGLVDYFLFDTKVSVVGHASKRDGAEAATPGSVAHYGGSGQQFDWRVLADYVGETPFLLSGGIGPDDTERVRAFCHPRCIGIDLNSRFETAPALKDAAVLTDFIAQLRIKH